ncbi:hypothetical protein [Leucobacter sp. wl10]|uniref:hypothetical protein n=1 Tax=Leucobacter sp. wl10 TaxID=2304677 RepID=UPI000E5C3A18|nr:hypothetical protein [Leucobacter sp. wl10]RGE22426.1 hypothetical protein D1J51_04180 [Leucobacter sp. wl10]
MVDLHQTVPGMPEGHPWLALSRWGIAWRTLLSSVLVGATAAPISLLVIWGPALLAGRTLVYGLAFIAPIPAVLGALSWAIGPWLKRYFPFSQMLIFGFLGLAAVALLAFAWLLISSIGYTCSPDDYCAPPLMDFFWFWILFALPVFLQSAIAYPLAIWASTRRGGKMLWPLLAAAIAVIVAVGLLAATGVIERVAR